MSRLMLFVVALLTAGASTAVAQTPSGRSAPSKASVAIGYSVLDLLANSDNGTEGLTLPVGWLFGVAGRLSEHAAIVGEVGGNYKSQQVFGTTVSANIHSFTGGLRFLGKPGSAIPFAEIQAGATRASSAIPGVISFSSTGFTFSPGAGIDIRANERVSFRAQGDFAFYRSGGVTDHAFRIAFSAVFALR